MMTLKDYLHSFNITLEAFSREVDIPYTTLTKYVYGQRIPTLTYMKKINKIAVMTSGGDSPARRPCSAHAGSPTSARAR